MTDDMIALRELLEKGSDATLLREMIGFAAQRLMELETEAVCGAGHGERSENRTNLRNGYRDRDWHTRVGTVDGSQSCARAAISRAFWSHAGWQRRR
jgi:putative transposase